MKIVYVVESLEISGGVKVIVEHAEGLADRGHDVSIVTRDPRHDWIPIRVPVQGVHAFDATTLPEADVHVATWFPTVVPTVKAGRARRIFHLSQGYEVTSPNLADRIPEIEEAYAQAVPKLLISRHLLALLQPRYPGPYFVLPQAIRVTDYTPPAAARRTAGPPVIGVVGPFEAEGKGIRVALRAARRLRDSGFDFLLSRVSQLPFPEAEKAIFLADRYLSGASVNQMVSWYRGLDLFIHPSFGGEGFPLPPLEAMASGVPVVLTSIASFDPIPADAVSRVTPGDDAGMAAAAAALLGDPALCERRRTRGLEVVREFDLPNVIERLEKIIASKTRVSPAR